MKMKTIAAAVAEGYTVNYHAPGRPTGYKGETFAPTERINLLTNLEADLLEILRNIVKFTDGSRNPDARGAKLLAGQAIERAEQHAGGLYDEPVIGAPSIVGRVDGITADGAIIEIKTATNGENHEPDPTLQTR